MRSMTAFARRELEAPWGSARWELRAVNNRFLDVSPRLPEELRVIEPAVRERIAARVSRGKVDCTLRIERASAAGTGLQIDEALAAEVARAAARAAALLERPAPVSPFELLRWPGVIRTDLADPEAVASAALELLEAALEDLVAAREREGERIAAMLEQRLEGIAELTARVRARLPEVIAAARERLAARVAELAAELDRERLEQEVALLAGKADVAEELDRLDAHCAEIRHAIAGRRPVGRRLDFLVQELHREANTLGSKSIDGETTRAAVDLKVLIEQLREQVQNVE